ncbi:PP-loop family protein [Diplocarpon rosae]|nr:PP-loop family protein [Diplocarpon rosae]
MGTSRLLYSAACSRPSQITVKEFANALSKVWRPANSLPRGQAVQIGNGGVDSMALASLCSRLSAADFPVQLDPHTSGRSYAASIRLRAFVVDHSARSGSATEAQAVSRLLEKQGISAQVLKIEWPEDPASKPNFESLARKYRFRALGKACRDWGTSSLFLAHHADDQAETVMMRLAAGHRSKGLTGIKYHSEIPECYGLHGIHESGGIDHPSMGTYLPLRKRGDLRDITNSIGSSSSATTFDHSVKSMVLDTSCDQEGLDWKPQLPVERGGVRVYRPLLDFSKERLIATCRANNIEWFEDHTNTDRTLTRRNAIRHLFAGHSLPAALTKPALLRMAGKMQDREAQRQDLVSSWLTRCQVTMLDLLTGTATVRFAALDKVKESRVLSEADLRRTAAELLKRILMLITPNEHVELSSLHGAVAHIFPEIVSREPPRHISGFTVCGVYFQRPRDNCRGEASPAPDPPCKPQWYLSRQPYAAHAGQTFALAFGPADGAWSPWRLFDGRYWFRLRNAHSVVLLVRPVRKDDWSDLRDLRASSTARTRLDERAPGAVRWTLPAIACLEADGTERVVALPTLGITLPGFQAVADSTWEIRYKKIETDGLICRRSR